MADFLDIICMECVCWLYCCSICTPSAEDKQYPVQTATPLRTITPRVAEHEANIIINAHSNPKQ